MSSSGQAPNVSMDELLASIKSMIEGESNGGAKSQQNLAAAQEPQQGGGLPDYPAPMEEAVMDLTQVVQQPAPQSFSQSQQPQSQKPESQQPQSHAGQPGGERQQGAEGFSAAPDGSGMMQPAPHGRPDPMHAGHVSGDGQSQDPFSQQHNHQPAQHGDQQEKPTPPQSLSQQTLVSPHDANQGVPDGYGRDGGQMSQQPSPGSAQETAAQINSLLGEMDDDFGIGQPERGGDAGQQPPSAADFGFDQGGAGQGRHEQSAAPAPGAVPLVIARNRQRLRHVQTIWAGAFSRLPRSRMLRHKGNCPRWRPDSKCLMAGNGLASRVK